MERKFPIRNFRKSVTLQGVSLFRKYLKLLFHWPLHVNFQQFNVNQNFLVKRKAPTDKMGTMLFYSMGVNYFHNIANFH